MEMIEEQASELEHISIESIQSDGEKQKNRWKMIGIQVCVRAKDLRGQQSEYQK